MSNPHQGTLYFVTDPICSWCWGTLPEVLKTRELLAERLDFRLRCAGLQVGSRQPLSQQRAAQLISLWQQVAQTTGQQFAFALPEDRSFIYHSELACRALQICRNALGTEPWAYFRDMQEAFYVHCRNLGDLDELYQIIRSCGISRERFQTLMTADDIVSTTRAEFDWCHAQGSDALPTIWLQTSRGISLVCGGYITSEFLVPELLGRLTTH